MQPASEMREYRPELIPRRGEITAWVLFLVVGAVWFVLILLHQRVAIPVPLMAGFMFLAAGSISLGNWMDRKTRLRLNDHEIEFQNGLRHVTLQWWQVREVQVSPAPWGKRVRVLAEKSYFDFHTLGEVKYRGEVKGRTGFVDGQEIVGQIIANSGLHIVGQPEGGYYVARK
jgi:hypothetical protein